MPFFSKVFRRDGPTSSSKSKKSAAQTNGSVAPPPKPKWENVWSMKEIPPEEIQELVHECTREMKSRGE
ncbi:MAG: hypothetical protein INR71_01445 [Terriglobus roseus]|nr:hypothetical protein [Terriglobus roseus]